MHHYQLSEMIGLWATHEITAKELHSYLLDHPESPAAHAVLQLLQQLLGDSIHLKQFFDRALEISYASEPIKLPDAATWHTGQAIAAESDAPTAPGGFIPLG